MDQLIRVVYGSAASDSFSTAMLGDLPGVARARNTALGVGESIGRHDLAGDSAVLRKLMEAFLDGRWRQAIR